MIFRSLDDVANYLDALPLVAERRIVGIVGAPGAGKSTVAEAITDRVNWALLPMDGYHLPQARLVELGRRERMGAPDTFDVTALLQTLADLRISGGPVFARGFDREIEEPVPDAIVIQPERDVILEGNYLLLDEGGWQEVAPLLDFCFFVDIDDELRRTRLIERHIRFGKTPETALDWVLGPDEANAQLIAATASRADHRIALN